MVNKFLRYHGEGNPDHEIVRIEMDEMRVAIETEGSDKVSSPTLCDQTQY